MLAGPESHLVSRELTLGSRVCQVQVHPIFSQGHDAARADTQPLAQVVILLDVTGERELEQAKADFFNMIAHDLRTPLTSNSAILRTLLMGRMGGLNEEQRDFLQTALEQADLLQKLIDQILDLARLDAREFRIEQAPVALGALIESVVDRLHLLAEEKGLTLTAETPPDLPAVRGDAERLEQVLTNLVHNAIKFTATGGVQIRVDTPADDLLQIRVCDSGPGIPAAELPYVFERFYQGRGQQKGGAGLGLAICKGIVEAHGGRIWAEGQLGRGSTFHCRVTTGTRTIEEAAGPPAPVRAIAAREDSDFSRFPPRACPSQACTHPRTPESSRLLRDLRTPGRGDRRRC